MSSASKDIVYSELVGRLIFRAARRNFPLSPSKATTISAKEYCQINIVTRLIMQKGLWFYDQFNFLSFAAGYFHVEKGKFEQIIRVSRRDRKCFPMPMERHGLSTLDEQDLKPFPFFFGKKPLTGCLDPNHSKRKKEKTKTFTCDYHIIWNFY